MFAKQLCGAAPRALLVSLWLAVGVGCGTFATPFPPVLSASATAVPTMTQRPQSAATVQLTRLIPTAEPVAAALATDTPFPSEVPIDTPSTGYLLVRGIPLTFTPGPAGTATATMGTLDPQQALVAQGNQIFHSVGTCYGCHDVTQNVRIVGPSLIGIASRAGQRMAGKSAAEYIRTTIIMPDQVVLDGYPKGVMPRNFSTLLSSDQIDALVAYLLTL